MTLYIAVHLHHNSHSFSVFDSQEYAQITLCTKIRNDKVKVFFLYVRTAFPLYIVGVGFIVII